MLGYANRFHGLNSLNYVHRQGQTVRGSQLTLKYGLNKRRQNFRVAVVVSKKVAKSAVVRNRIRRRVYAAVRPLLPMIDRPYDLVFMVFGAQLATIEPAQLAKMVASHLENAGVTKAIKAPQRAIVVPEEEKK